MSTTTSPILSFRTMRVRKRAATHNNCNRSMDMINEKHNVTLENSFEKTLSDALSPQFRPRSGAILKLGGSPDRMRPSPVSSLPTSMADIRPLSAANPRVRTRQRRQTQVEIKEPEKKKEEKSLTLEEYRDRAHMKNFLATKFQQFKDSQNKEKEKDEIDLGFLSAAPSRPETPRRKSSSPERSQKKLRKATGSIFAKMEKNLFFTRMLSNYADEDKASLSFVEKINHVDRDRKEDRFRWMMKREKKNDHINLWLTRTSQITNEITQYISKPDDSKDLIEICQDKVDSQVKRIRVKNAKLDQGFDRSDDRVDPRDKEEVLKRAKAWNPALYNAFKNHPVKRKNESDNKSKDRQGFYNYLLLKEKKIVNQIVLNASCSKPRETFSRTGGRGIFNGSSG